MENNQKGIKNYWNILKEELSKNKRATFLIFIFFVLITSVFLWIDRESMTTTTMLPVIVGLLALILGVSIGLVSRRRYENAIAGKDLWDITAIKFRRYAIVSSIMFAMFALLSFWKGHFSFSPDPNFSMGLFSAVVFCVVASILFLVVASLFKRKSPKAITVGYTCFLLLLIPAVYLFFNSFFDYNNNLYYQFWLFLSFFLIQGLVDIYKVSKYTADIKRDSELQKEIIKIKAEEK